MGEGTYLLLVDTLRKKPRPVLWRLCHHLRIVVRSAGTDQTGRKLAHVHYGQQLALCEQINGDDSEHMLAKGIALALSLRVNEIEQARHELVGAGELVGDDVEFGQHTTVALSIEELEKLVAYCKHCGREHGPQGLSYRSTCCAESFVSDRNFSWAGELEEEPIEALAFDAQKLLSSHGLARFLLEGPDVQVTLDYGNDLTVQASWSESSEKRWKRYLETEPDWNPPEETPRPEGVAAAQFGPAVELAARAMYEQTVGDGREKS